MSALLLRTLRVPVRSLGAPAYNRTALIKELRARTAAPMKKCVEALDKASGDVEEAISELRKIGIASAKKKASRGANEGVVSVVNDGVKAAVVELNSETDFVAMNNTFCSLSLSLARTVLLGAVEDNGSKEPREVDISDLSETILDGDTCPVSEALGVAIGQLGENIVVRRACMLKAPPAGGVVCSYVHNTYSPNVGRIAALVTLASKTSDLEALRR